MSFTDHKISQFVHRVVDLPDQPNLPSDELKARFDSSPEELRVAHNALCDDADRLDDRVSGIIAETFGDTISKSMLSDELADEIDAKATQTQLATEVATLEAADEALAEEIDQKLAQKCEIYCGSYNYNTSGGDTLTINLGFRPAAVIVCSYSSLSGITGGQSYLSIALDGVRSSSVEIINNGFTVIGYLNHSSNGGSPYRYIAFKPIG